MHVGSTGQPGKSGGWSSTVKLITQQAKSGSLQANFSKAEYYTVQFTVEPPTGASDGIYAATATIAWTVEGNNVYRIVSIGNGVAISGTGEAISVTVNDVTPNVGQAPGFEYKVNIQVSPGTRANISQPPTYMRGSDQQVPILGDSFALIDVPQNAGVVSVQLSGYTESSPESQPKWLVNFLSNTTVLKSVFVDSQLPFITLPPGCTFVGVYNLDVLNATRVDFTWGIEG